MLYGYVVQCLHDVTAFGVMDICWCKNCTKLTQKIVCSTVKKNNISHSNIGINLKLHLWSSKVVLCNFTVPWLHLFMTLLYHIRITQHIHYIMYNKYLSQYTNTQYTHYNTQPLHNIFSNSINHWHHVSVTSHTFHIMCPDDIIWAFNTASRCPHHTIYPVHHILEHHTRIS